MTTLVAVRQPPLPVSMSNQPDRGTGKRLAGAAAFENDDDFVFTRKPKKQRTDAVAEAAAAPVRRSPRNKPPAADAPSKTTAATKTTTLRRSTTRTEAASPSHDAERRRKQPSASASANASGARHSSRDKTSSRDAQPSKQRVGQQEDRTFQSPPPPPPRTESATITLPTSDTPVMARNKEMRKKAAEGSGSGAGNFSGSGGSSSSSNRRSSLGTRGRRASSLIESGQAAIPHREVDSRDFYKHISAEGLLEPMRMKQLLTWCAERALPEKLRQGAPSTSPALGARMILDELLKEFSTRSDFSNWLARDESVPPATRTLEPNPRNVELDKKMASLEARIKRLQEEKNAWQSIQKPPPDQPQLFPASDDTAQEAPPGASDDDNAEPLPKVQLPDFDLLDADEGEIHRYLAAELEPLAGVRARTESRLRAVQKTLEFEVDHLADNVHKLEQRVRVAGLQADAVLRVAAERLRRRAERDKRSAGTRDMPMMEVLRSLGSLLPEGGGGGRGGDMG